MTDFKGPGGAPYSGEDRRQRHPNTPTGTGERSPLAIAACLVAGVAVAFFIGPFAAPSDIEGLSEGVEPLLNSAAAAVAVIIGGLCFVRWRLTGQACSLWLAAALLTYGLVTVTVGHLLPVVAGDEPQVLLWLHPASRLVVIALVLTALLSPTVRSELRPWRVVVRATAGVAGLTVLFQLLPALGRALAGAEDGVAEALAFPTGSPILIGLFVAVAVTAFVQSVRVPDPIFAWFGVFLFALAAAEAHRLLAIDQVGTWDLGGGVLRLTGLLVAVTGTTRDLVATYGEQGGRLLESVATGATAEARIRAEAAAQEERAHEARNALAAIEGATRTLEHYRDRLDPETRASLASAISGEIARLQDLVSVERSKSEPEAFAVARAIRHVIAAARSHGLEIDAEIDPDLRAFGLSASTAEVVQNLIENARRYASGSPIEIRAGVEQGGAVIRVEDRGPGVEEHERKIIFTRGARGGSSSRTDGSGLGLYVSLELMREQSGDLWVEERAGGGASFVVWLPSPDAERPARSTDRADEDGAAPSNPLRAVKSEDGQGPQKRASSR